VLKAQGESQAIETVFKAIHEGNPDPELLSYQYLQMLPRIAEGSANKIWIVPSEFTQALSRLGNQLLPPGAQPPGPPPAAPPATPDGGAADGGVTSSGGPS
jgi:regulator of protease activity HflC (stomatin/prohibitin superfamily)